MHYTGYGSRITCLNLTLLRVRVVCSQSTLQRLLRRQILKKTPFSNESVTLLPSNTGVSVGTRLSEKQRENSLITLLRLWRRWSEEHTDMHQTASGSARTIQGRGERYLSVRNRNENFLQVRGAFVEAAGRMFSKTMHVCRTFCATTYRLEDVTRLVALRGVKLNWNETLFVLVKFCLGEVEGEVEHLWHSPEVV
jgi:hypothetical protein